MSEERGRGEGSGDTDVFSGCVFALDREITVLVANQEGALLRRSLRVSIVCRFRGSISESFLGPSFRSCARLRVFRTAERGPMYFLSEIKRERESRARIMPTIETSPDDLNLITAEFVIYFRAFLPSASCADNGENSNLRKKRRESRMVDQLFRSTTAQSQHECKGGSLATFGSR